MTAFELRMLFKELLQRNNIIAEIERLFERALITGAINYENDDPENFRVPKIILNAILLEICERLPLDDDCKKEAQNLQKFL